MDCSCCAMKELTTVWVKQAVKTVDRNCVWGELKALFTSIWSLLEAVMSLLEDVRVCICVVLRWSLSWPLYIPSYGSAFQYHYFSIIDPISFCWSIIYLLCHCRTALVWHIWTCIRKLFVGRMLCCNGKTAFRYAVSCFILSLSLVSCTCSKLDILCFPLRVQP